MYANNIHVPMEYSCNICGFMNPNFKDYQELYSNYCPRAVGSISEGSDGLYFNRIYAVRRQNEVERSPNRSRFSSYNIIEKVGPEWLRYELQRLFPETSNPAPSVLLSDPGKLSARVLGLFEIHLSGRGRREGTGGGETDISKGIVKILWSYGHITHRKKLIAYRHSDLNVDFITLEELDETIKSFLKLSRYHHADDKGERGIAITHS
jgi:hypothetical protein